MGDTSGDIQSSSKAGIPFIFAAYGFGELADDELPAAVITEFSGLKETILTVEGFG